jgi:hypothetical protein
LPLRSIFNLAIFASQRSRVTSFIGLFSVVNRTEFGLTEGSLFVVLEGAPTPSDRYQRCLKTRAMVIVAARSDQTLSPAASSERCDGISTHDRPTARYPPRSGAYSNARLLANDLRLQAGNAEAVDDACWLSARWCQMRYRLVAPRRTLPKRDGRAGGAFSVQKRRFNAIYARCATRPRIGSSRRLHGIPEDDHRIVGSTTSERVEPVWMGARSRSGPRAPRSMRDQL